MFTLTHSCEWEHLRLTVVQYEVHSFLTVKLDVPGQILVSVSIYTHRKAWLPLFPSIKCSSVVRKHHEITNCMCGINSPEDFLPPIQLFVPVLLDQTGLVILRQTCYDSKSV